VTAAVGLTTAVPVLELCTSSLSDSKKPTNNKLSTTFHSYSFYDHVSSSTCRSDAGCRSGACDQPLASTGRLSRALQHARGGIQKSYTFTAEKAHVTDLCRMDSSTRTVLHRKFQCRKGDHCSQTRCRPCSSFSLCSSTVVIHLCWPSRCCAGSDAPWCHCQATSQEPHPFAAGCIFAKFHHLRVPASWC
jgi:hypothetical protein